MPTLPSGILHIHHSIRDGSASSAAHVSDGPGIRHGLAVPRGYGIRTLVDYLNDFGDILCQTIRFE